LIVQIGCYWLNLSRMTNVERSINSKGAPVVQVYFDPANDSDSSVLFYDDEAVALAAILDGLAGKNRYPKPK
jgi:hypothetical protein